MKDSFHFHRIAIVLDWSEAFGQFASALEPLRDQLFRPALGRVFMQLAIPQHSIMICFYDTAHAPSVVPP